MDIIRNGLWPMLGSGTAAMIRFEDGGWWLPDGEEHLQQWMLTVNKRFKDRLTYQYHKYEMALRWARPAWQVAVDVGAHVGLWSWPMSHDFGAVVAFEPMSAHRECYLRNMDGRPNFTLHGVALGETDGTAFLRTRTPGSSGDTGVDQAAERSSLRASVDTDGELVDMKRLDDFDLKNVTLLKIDCEGYELFVLRGAVETLKRCKPCVIVEQKPETGMEQRYGIGTTDAVKFLEGLGAVKRAGIQGDYILSW